MSPSSLPRPSSARHDSIERRPFGRHADLVSIIGLGGYHLGKAKTVAEAVRIVHEAIDAGINFLDNAWEYHDGESERRMGRAIADRRDSVFLMTKVCTHGRDRKVALRQLDASLRRLRTDYLDLWQIHECVYYKDIFATLLPTLQATPGARPLLEYLREHRVDLVIATSADDRELSALLEQAGVDDLIPERASKDDAPESKPDPDIVQAALSRAHARPEQSVLIGDTPYDIEAAHRAGIRAIALRCGGYWPDSSLRGALEILDDPLALLSYCRSRRVPDLRAFNV
jgi:HAD superfamily hydrolase (TIGR01509 family)